MDISSQVMGMTAFAVMFLLIALRVPIAAMAAVIVLSNVLVQHPINDWLTWGAFTYPLVNLVSDLTNRALGPMAARRVAWIGFAIAVAVSLGLAPWRIALASAKQCGRSLLPLLEPARPLAEALARDGFHVANLEYPRTGMPGGGWPGTARSVLARLESAHADTKLPDRIVVRSEDARAREVMTELYRPLYLNAAPLLFTGRRNALATQDTCIVCVLTPAGARRSDANCNKLFRRRGRQHGVCRGHQAHPDRGQHGCEPDQRDDEHQAVPIDGAADDADRRGVGLARRHAVEDCRVLRA